MEKVENAWFNTRRLRLMHKGMHIKHIAEKSNMHPRKLGMQIFSPTSL